MKRLFLLSFFLFLMSIFQAFAADCGNDTLKRTVREDVALPTNTVSKAINQWLQQHQCKIIFVADDDIIGFEYQDKLYLAGFTNGVLLLHRTFYLEDEVYSFLNQKGHLQKYLESANSAIGIKAEASQIEGSNKYQIILRCEMFTCGHAVDPFMECAIRLLDRWYNKIYPYYNIYFETKNAEAKTKK